MMMRSAHVRGAAIEIREGGDVYTVDTSDDDGGGPSRWVGNVWDGLHLRLGLGLDDEFAALVREYVDSTEFVDASHAEWNRDYCTERGVR